VLSLIIPTYNERHNIESLLIKVCEVLGARDYEIIVVDDNSPDGTGDIVSSLEKKIKNIRLITRKEERGLATAVVVGFREARGDILGVMDADLSHDVKLLPKMLDAFHEESVNCVVASRCMAGGGFVGWPWYRTFFSRSAAFLARMLSGVSVSDPTSGYFCVSRQVIQESLSRLKPKGYKILLEVLVKAKSLHIREIPFQFADRQHGQSKLTLAVTCDYFLHLAELWWYRLVKKR